MPVEIEEDGEDVFTPMPSRCRKMIFHPVTFGLIGNCDGKVLPAGGFYVCDGCGVSYGPVSTPAEMPKESYRDTLHEHPLNADFKIVDPDFPRMPLEKQAEHPDHQPKDVTR